MFFKQHTSIRVVAGVLFLLLFAGVILGQSTISGFITDKQRSPLGDVDVELLNDYYQQIKRARTDASGRYTFEGLNDGRYSVRVLPFRYDLEDQTQMIEIQTMDTTDVRGQRKSGVSFQTLDFTLVPKKGGLAESELGVVFAQNVPADAKKAYDKALGDLSAKRTTDGIMELNKAVTVFPSYYLALHRLGKELYLLRKYEDAVPFFFKAAEINPKSATSFYYLGSALSNLGKDYSKASLAALNQAFLIAPGSAQVAYQLGKVERSSGDFANAEVHLLKAKKLSRVSIPEIHKELAQLYANDLKKYNEAAAELEIYLKNSKPSDAETAQMKKLISDLREKGKVKPTEE